MAEKTLAELNPTVIEMVTEQLKNKGFDGLYSSNGECACDISDLAPCGEIQDDCHAGFKKLGCSELCGMGCNFHIVRRLP